MAGTQTPLPKSSCLRDIATTTSSYCRAQQIGKPPIVLIQITIRLPGCMRDYGVFLQTALRFATAFFGREPECVLDGLWIALGRTNLIPPPLQNLSDDGQ